MEADRDDLIEHLRERLTEIETALDQAESISDDSTLEWLRTRRDLFESAVHEIGS